MDVQVLELERAHYFRIKYDCRCMCVCVLCVFVCVCACVLACVRAYCMPFLKITSIISSSTYCKSLLDEVVMEIKNYFLAILVFSKLWVAKVVLPWLAAQNI